MTIGGSSVLLLLEETKWLLNARVLCEACLLHSFHLVILIERGDIVVCCSRGAHFNRRVRFVSTTIFVHVIIVKDIAGQIVGSRSCRHLFATTGCLAGRASKDCSCETVSLQQSLFRLWVLLFTSRAFGARGFVSPAAVIVLVGAGWAGGWCDLTQVIKDGG